jgi:hypothetical protein
MLNAVTERKMQRTLDVEYLRQNKSKEADGRIAKS